jgi:hypothetical protein
MRTKLITTLVVLVLGTGVWGQTIEFTGKNRLVCYENSAAENAAASILQPYLAESTGYAFPIAQGKIRKGDIVLKERADLPEDAFRISLKEGSVLLEGSGKALSYAACDFLEQEVGMNYWGGGEYDLPRVNTVIVRPRTEIPAFRYRQCSHYLLREDPLLRTWMRLEEPSDLFVDNLWVHTCNRLLPASRYGAEHPEYYAYYGGKRHPGSASQWCLSNPDVLEIVCGTLDSLFHAHPQQNCISISQNDGSDTYCRCPACQAIMDEEGSPSGPILRFVNAVAERFPDKEISTLAYLFSVKPPKVTKPRPNVNIMLCDIDCRRQTSLPENPSGQEFMRHLEGWSAICNNIFLWDYGINFDNYLSPFPNLQTIKDNMVIFQDHGVKMHFSQINSSRGGDMAELRPYLVSKLMWNPSASLDSLERHFCEAYYGNAAPYILHYIHTLEGAAVATDVDLFIYDSPVSYKGNILQPALLKRYNALFDQAEAAVAHQPLQLSRVRRTRLPLQYSALEIARTDINRNNVAVEKDLDLFESRIREFQVPSLNERANSPLDYCELYRKRYLSSPEGNLAYGCPVTFTIEPRPRYAQLGLTALTDGLYGGAGYVESWVGWEGTDADFTIDLGAIKPIHEMGADFLRQIGAWVLEPKAVRFLVSDDGKDFRPFDYVQLEENRSGTIEFTPVTGKGLTTARYVRIQVEGVKDCPEWHYGVGNPCWFFIDEVWVK